MKTFTDVFGGLGLTGAGAFDGAVVRGVSFSRDTGKLDVEMELFGVVAQERFVALENELAEKLQVSNVNIKHVYSLDMAVENAVAALWKNIVYDTNVNSPVCGQILSVAEWRLDKNDISVSVPASNIFVLKTKGAHKRIQQMVDSLGKGLRVVFNPVENGGDLLERAKEREIEGLRVESLEFSEKAVNHEKHEIAVQARNDGVVKRNDGAVKRGGGRRAVKVNAELSGVISKLNEELLVDDEVLAEGRIFDVDVRETKSGKVLCSFDISDGTGAATVKFFCKPERFGEFKSIVVKGGGIRVLGRVQNDEYSKETNIMALELCAADLPETGREDNAEVKRVELHLHTAMSAMDGMAAVADYIKQAAKWGHKAVAVTDHGVAQAFPDAYEWGKKTGVKVIYGMEAYLVDDLRVMVARELAGKDYSTPIVVFDLETTGLAKELNKIIEIGAVKIVNGEITERFSQLINPNEPLAERITQLTGITDEMLADKPHIKDVLPKFIDFIGECALAAHNADFDVGFLKEVSRKLGYSLKNGYTCTLDLSRMLFSDLGSHKLNVVARHLGVELKNHHRAVDDAQAAAGILLACFKELINMGVTDYDSLNTMAAKNVVMKNIRHTHAVILVKNKTGLRNLYELISNSHIKHFYRRPRVPKSEFMRLREGLMIGTACEAGELFVAVLENKPEAEIERIAEFYDYFEIQPTGNNDYLVRNGRVDDIDGLRALNKRIVALGEQYNKKVVAACDAHFLNPEDEVYRRIVMSGDGFKDADNQAPLFYRTTEEMLAEFAYLGTDKAYEVVVTNTNLVNEMIDDIRPIPDGTFPPKIDGSEQELEAVTYEAARRMYGENLPPAVSARLERELGSIIKNGFAVMYIIARKLVQNSVENGYVVGSRGSIGSSLVATMSDITEVNPLPAHYYCADCKYSDFNSETVSRFAGMSGCDMPDMDCPVCGVALKKEGHDIPFETFLGFDGDKEPDIDLNFSGEYQARAHAYAEELFGSDYVFRAGTISTLADKTAFGYVKKYMDERNMTARNAEINRLVTGVVGVKKSTGQHPGGLMVVPKGRSIYEFTPIQRPANDMKTDVVTTHFDYNAISENLLKLDLLGHKVPTIIRMLHDITGVDPMGADLGDKKVLSLLTSPKALGVTKHDINCATGTLGLPELGTGFVRQMLVEAKPSNFSELIGISGLSHGTNVWVGNAQEFIKEGAATLKEVITTRDGIMTYLIYKGVEKLAAFKIMESVRRGRSVTDEEAVLMTAAGVPAWYIESCRRIKYLFPKGHATAYVMMAVRIGRFKIHYPYAFYAAVFSVEADDFDYQTMCKGKETALAEMRRITELGNDATQKDKGKQTLLELVLEMYARGLNFVPLDLYKSLADKFVVCEKGLMPPLCSVAGLGKNAAAAIAEARADGEFFSIEDFKQRTKTTKTVIEILKANNILKGIPETAQLSLFDV